MFAMPQFFKMMRIFHLPIYSAIRYRLFNTRSNGSGPQRLASSGRADDGRPYVETKILGSVQGLVISRSLDAALTRSIRNGKFMTTYAFDFTPRHHSLEDDGTQENATSRDQWERDV